MTSGEVVQGESGQYMTLPECARLSITVIFCADTARDLQLVHNLVFIWGLVTWSYFTLKMLLKDLPIVCGSH